MCDDTTPLTCDGFDAAIIGATEPQPGRPSLVVYDLGQMVEILMHTGEMSFEEAAEFLSFNTVGAWVGPGTPLFLHRRPSDVPPDAFLAEFFDGTGCA